MKQVVRLAGFEPTTYGLKDRCSTTELKALVRHYRSSRVCLVL